jgi:glycosyltransferase involved in cell wall biosynthesis
MRDVRLLAYSDGFAWGGAEQCLATLLGALSPAFDVRVAGTDAAVVERLAGARPGTRADLLPPFRGKFDLSSIAAHIQLFRRADADVCHLNMRTPYSCQAAIAAANVTRTRAVVVEHLPFHSPSRFMRWSRRHLAGRYDAHVSVGLASARLIEAELGLPRGAVGTIHNGVPTIDEPVRAPRADGFVVGTIGRLEEQKNHRLLLEALADLPGARCVIIGDGSLGGALKSHAAELGVADRVEFRGWSDDARSQLVDFDVFALSSDYEGFPLVVLEAMLAGVAIVATDVGSVSEAIDDGRTGLLVPANDRRAMVAALAALAANPARRRQLAEAARGDAERMFTAQAMAERYAQLYREVVAARRRRA